MNFIVKDERGKVVTIGVGFLIWSKYMSILSVEAVP